MSTAQLSPEQFYELKKKLDAVLSGTGAAPKTAADVANEEDELPWKPEPVVAKSAPAPAPKVSKAPAMEDDDDDDALSYFQKIADAD